MIQFLQNLIDALALGSIYALVALGIGLLFGILRLINFAHGDMITIGCYALIVPSADVTAHLLIGAWTPLLVIPAIAVIVMAAALLTEAFVFRPLAARLLADPDDRLVRGQLYHPERHPDELRGPPQGGRLLERRQQPDRRRRASACRCCSSSPSW